MANQEPPITWAMKMTHSRYWLFWSTAVPMAITLIGFMWAGHEMLKMKAENDHLRMQLSACEADFHQLR